jgi:hypothetical protein
MDGHQEILVVANRTADSDELLAALKARAKEGLASFTLLVPATPHGVAWATEMHSGDHEAELQMQKALTRMRDAGLDVKGRVGDPDPVAAVHDAVNAGNGFDEAIVSTLPVHLSRWLKLDLPRRVERATGMTVHHVIGSEAGITNPAG